WTNLGNPMVVEFPVAQSRARMALVAGGAADEQLGTSNGLHREGGPIAVHVAIERRVGVDQRAFVGFDGLAQAREDAVDGLGVLRGHAVETWASWLALGRKTNGIREVRHRTKNRLEGVAVVIEEDMGDPQARAVHLAGALDGAQRLAPQGILAAVPEHP